MNLVLVGDTNTGKTAILQRFVDDIFGQPSSFTVGQLYEAIYKVQVKMAFCPFYMYIGVDFKIREIQVDGMRVKLQIWYT